MTLPDAYMEMLRCVEAQAVAIANEEWQTFEELTARRCALVVAAEQCLIELPTDADEIAHASALLQQVMVANASLVHGIEEQSAELMEEARRLRRLRLLAAAYQSTTIGAYDSVYLDEHS